MTQEPGVLTFTDNKDGTISVEVEGKQIRYAKESDLLAVKGASEVKVKEWETTVATHNTAMAEANRLREEAHTSFVQEQAAKELLVTQFADYDTHKTRVGELETEKVGLVERATGMETELVARVTATLVGKGATAESLQGKTLDQLRNIEEAANILGSNGGQPRPGNYESGQGGGQQGSVAETDLERAHRILAEHEELGHRIGGKTQPGK